MSSLVLLLLAIALIIILIIMYILTNNTNDFKKCYTITTRLMILIRVMCMYSQQLLLKMETDSRINTLRRVAKTATRMSQKLWLKGHLFDLYSVKVESLTTASTCFEVIFYIATTCLTTVYIYIYIATKRTHTARRDPAYQGLRHPSLKRTSSEPADLRIHQFVIFEGELQAVTEV